MGAQSNDGPIYNYGNMAAIPAGLTGFPVPDPNLDAGPNGVFQGEGFLDCRFLLILRHLRFSFTFSLI